MHTVSVAGTARPLRILHCPWNVAGQSAQLAAAERSLGTDSRCIVLEETAIGFPADECLARPHATRTEREIARWKLLWRAIRWADVVHFSFGQSCLVPHAYPGLAGVDLKSPMAVLRRLYSRLIWLKDLPLLSALGKTLAVTWQGDDARQRDKSLELFDISIARALRDCAGYYAPGSDHWKRRTILEFDRYVPLHYAVNPDLLHVLPKRAKFLPYASFDPLTVTASTPERAIGHALRIAHAPSHRGAKGTEYVLAAVQALRSEGTLIELDLVEGVSRGEALKRYAQSHVVVDQLFAGWYGGLAVEAMALGKPVISYLRQSDLSLVNGSLLADLPIISANSETLINVLRELAQTNSSNLRALGHKSRAFVLRHHTPQAIASRTLADYQAVRSKQLSK